MIGVRITPSAVPFDGGTGVPRSRARRRECRLSGPSVGLFGVAAISGAALLCYGALLVVTLRNGLSQASQRYFKRSPAALTSLQAARLAALAPSPRQLARRLDSPRPDLIWTNRIDLLLRLMRRRSGQTKPAHGELSLLNHSRRQ